MHPYDLATAKATEILRLRRRRAELLPDELFSEPAWDLLLELFIADAAGRSLTGGEVTKRIGTAPSVMSRWLIHLHKLRLILGDGKGDLTDRLVIAPLALEKIEQLMQNEPPARRT